MNYDLEVIGKRIREERTKRGWSQKNLGDKIPVAGKQISNYESKAKPNEPLHLPPLETLLKLCDVFDCELGYLLGDPEYQNGTRFRTSVSDYTNLTPEALEAIRKATGKIKGNVGVNRYNTNDYARVLNSFFCANHFLEFVRCLIELDSSLSSLDQKWAKFESEVDVKEISQFVNSQIDYEHNSEAPELNPTQIENISSYNNLIDEEREASFKSKVARYELSIAFERLIDELYPLQ